MPIMNESTSDMSVPESYDFNDPINQEYLEMSYNRIAEANIEQPEGAVILEAKDISCMSMEMSDEQIRRYLIDNAFIPNDCPIIPYTEIAFSTNWSNLTQRFNFVKSLADCFRKLTTMSNGQINQAELTRVKTIAKNVDKIQETYQENIEYLPERIKDKIQSISLVSKIIIGVGIVLIIVFGLFVLYNFLKSYGTEKGKIIANR